MGPRPRSRGIVPGNSRPLRTAHASMGPRPRSRGIVDLAAQAAAISATLQWGRDRAVAEFRVERTPECPAPSFNGAATAQSRNSARSRSRCTSKGGFNGAATAQSRNLGIRFVRHSDDHASMGPRPRSRGIIDSPTPPAAPGGASMGPRPRSRGIPSMPTYAVGYLLSFNGAATAQSRN